MSWDELMQFQASLPALDVPGTPVQESLELPARELTSLEGHDAKVKSADLGGVEKSTTSCTGFPSVPSPGIDFAGQADTPDGIGFSFIPSDTTGAVGPAHLMMMLNNKVLIQDRFGASTLAVDTSTFWFPLGATPLSPTNTFHRVSYDAISGRWIASARNGVGSLGTTVIFFAISQTNDPTGFWDYYSFVADGTSTTQADWVVHGYNSTWIAIAADMLNLAGTAFAAQKIWMVDKATALVPGGPITVNVFTNYQTAASGFGTTRLYPSRALDVGAPLYIVQTGSFTIGGVQIWQVLQVTGTGSSPGFTTVGTSTIGSATSGFFTVVNNYTNTTRTMPESGEATRTLSAFSTRVAAVVVRGGHIYATNSCGLPGPSTNTTPTATGVAWYDINLTGMPTPIVQSGMIGGAAATCNAYPSISVNCAGDVLLGFTTGDATIFPSAVYTMHLATDGPGVMSPVTTLKAGLSKYWKNFGVGSAVTCVFGRWSATVVDPVDDNSFWTLQNFADLRVGAADNDSRWGTWWARYGTCGTPLVTDDPDDYVACIGGNASFTATVSPSAPPVQYQWRKGGVDISGETNQTLNLSGITLGDLDDYDVRVTDGCGGQAVSAPAALIEATTPTVDVQPAPYTLQCTGGNVTLTASGSSNKAVTYQWRKDGFDIIGETTNTLNLTNVSLADEAFYDVGVDNGCEITYSDPAQVDVEVGPVVLSQSDDEAVCVGDPVTLSVNPNAGAFTYQWRKDGFDIVGETNTSLSIPSVSLAELGSYDLKITASCGFILSAPIQLSFNSPQISDQPDPYTVCEGALVTLFVSATSNPPNQAITYQWRKDTIPLGPPSNQNFLAFNAAPSDQGVYDCVLDNACSPTVTTIPVQVTVNTAPEIQVEPVDTVAHLYGPATLSVSATGQGGLTYQWYRGVTPVGGNSPTLSFNHVRPPDLGDYHVDITTVCGMVTSDTVTLSVDKTQEGRTPVR